MSKRLRICDAAIIVLRETDNPAVMHGDDGLLKLIADRAGSRSKKWGPFLADYIIGALAKCPGDLFPAYTVSAHGNRRVRIFYLPEVAE